MQVLLGKTGHQRFGSSKESSLTDIKWWQRLAAVYDGFRHSMALLWRSEFGSQGSQLFICRTSRTSALGRRANEKMHGMRSLHASTCIDAYGCWCWLQSKWWKSLKGMRHDETHDWYDSWVSDQPLSLSLFIARMALSCRSPVAFWPERVMHWKMVVCWLCTDPSRPHPASQAPDPAMLNSNSGRLTASLPPRATQTLMQLWGATHSGSMVNMLWKNMNLQTHSEKLDDYVEGCQTWTISSCLASSSMPLHLISGLAMLNGATGILMTLLQKLASVACFFKAKRLCQRNLTSKLCVFSFSGLFSFPVLEEWMKMSSGLACFACIEHSIDGSIWRTFPV